MTSRPITASVAPAMNVRDKPADTVGTAARGELAGMDLGMRVLSYLIAGVLCYGGLGWLGDHLLGTAFLLPIGIVLGAAGGCYVVIRRYGQQPQEGTAITGRRYSPTGRRLPNYWTTNRKKEGAR